MGSHMTRSTCSYGLHSCAPLPRAHWHTARSQTPLLPNPLIWSTLDELRVILPYALYELSESSVICLLMLGRFAHRSLSVISYSLRTYNILRFARSYPILPLPTIIIMPSESWLTQNPRAIPFLIAFTPICGLPDHATWFHVVVTAYFAAFSCEQAIDGVWGDQNRRQRTDVCFFQVFLTSHLVLSSLCPANPALL
jgi:hypothetical protein